MITYFNKKGQSTLEYALIIIIMLGALLTVQIYFKRGMQGRWKAAVDDLADQYDPRLANSCVRNTSQSDSVTLIKAVNASGRFYTSRTDVTDSTSRRLGTDAVSTEYTPCPTNP